MSCSLPPSAGRFAGGASGPGHPRTEYCRRPSAGPPGSRRAHGSPGPLSSVPIRLFPSVLVTVRPP